MQHPPPSGPVELGVLTWNVQNLFDSQDDPATEDEVLSAGRLMATLEGISDVIRASDPDFVFLEEVENEGLLHNLADLYLPGRGYDYRGLMDSGDPRGIDVGYLSRIEPEMVANHQSERFTTPGGSREYSFARDAVEVFLTVGDTPMIFIGVHLRSQRDGGGDEHRLAEATQIRRIVERRMELGHTHIVVAGDFNDTQSSDALTTLVADGPLVDVSTYLPGDNRWTIQHAGRRMQFDYILATPPAMEMVLTDEVYILRGPEVSDTSDHAPVLARFRIP